MNLVQSNGANLTGWLFKWTNYIKGYQKRWFVLNQGILSYYRSQAEMKYTCRGTVYMKNATIITLDALHFVIKNGSATIHVKAENESDKQRWISALELSKSVKFEPTSHNDDVLYRDGEIILSDTDSYYSDKQLQQKLDELEACFDLVKKQHHAIQKCIRSLDNEEKAKRELMNLDERTTIFRVTATSLINNCRTFLLNAKNQRGAISKAFSEERELRMRLEDIVEKMAKQQKMIERNVLRTSKASYMPGEVAFSKQMSQNDVKESEDDEFHDALDQELLRMPLSSMISDTPKISSPDDSESEAVRFKYDYESSESCEEDEFEENRIDDEITSPTILIHMPHSKRSDKAISSDEKKEIEPSDEQKLQRRTSIPPKPEYSLNLWSIIKNCVGKDLTKIPVPVNFSEPLSMLQRLTEELEYSELLDKAALCTNSHEQMAYVAAFTISVYSTTAERAAKPFNPLLGETFECDRLSDLGWKSIAEQVSHHPPSLANYAEGKSWKLWQEFTMTSKFRGQYLSVTPLGHSHLTFSSSNNHYTWKKVTTCVQNIIVGKLWIDNVGEMDIINHITKDRCHIKFYEYSMFSKDSPRKVAGIITDENKVARWIVSGKWNEFIEAAKVINPDTITSRTRFETENPIVLWKRKYPPAYLSKMYNFTTLAVQLNEPEDGVAPTDSRLRPDQRLMESGNWDDANAEKIRLEEKQREKRKATEELNEKRKIEDLPPIDHMPSWFKKQHDEFTDSFVHVYTHEYWQCKERQDWSRCPDIF